MSVLALSSPLDQMLGVVGPLGAATAVDTALVIDLDPDGPRFGGPTSLAELVAKGPTREQLIPARRGPAVLRNGGIAPDASSEVVQALVSAWPRVVLRCPPTTDKAFGGLTLLPLLPEPFHVTVEGQSVYQKTRWAMRPPKGITALPVPRRATIAALLAGSKPPVRDRWVGSLGDLWTP